MAAIQSANQSPRVTTAALNSVGRVGDPAPGVVVSTANVSGSIVQPYSGMLGGKLTLSAADATVLSDTATGALYGGVYQYVRFLLTSTATAARGCLVRWVTPTVATALYVVTPDGSATGDNSCAGVALNATTKGNYDFIQTQGIAQVKVQASITAATPAIGDAIFVGTNANPQLADDMEGSTVSTILLRKFIGVALTAAPAASTVSPVWLALKQIF
ncbi:MAG TPA: hypothetical protein VEL77_15260 [Rugosimonospora sp.]|nr:hypothetical protein [Rugosimonospora sp.]